jgi:hypothetical protein
MLPKEEAQAPAETQDQPTEAPPETGQPEEDRFTDVRLDEAPEGEITPDFLKSRYEQMQADYSKKTMGLAEQRRAFEQAGFSPDWIKAYSDPDTREQAVNWLLQQNGIVLEDEDQPAEGEEEDDFEFRDPRVDGLLAEREQEQMAKLVGEVEDHFKGMAKDAKLDLPERWLKALTREALEGQPSPQRSEELFKGWAEDLKGIRDGAIDAYRNSKDTPAPPPKSGTSGTPEFDITDPAERRKRMMQIADEHYAGS